jgi:hypothetical protein
MSTDNVNLRFLARRDDFEGSRAAASQPGTTKNDGLPHGQVVWQTAQVCVEGALWFSPGSNCLTSVPIPEILPYRQLHRRAV